MRGLTLTFFFIKCCCWEITFYMIKVAAYWNLLKGDLLCNNYFYKLFEHSCVATVCEHNQPIMLKIHTLIKKKKKNHEQSLQTSCLSFPSFSLCSSHRRGKARPFVKHSPEWEAAVHHYWRYIQCQRQRGITRIVFWDALTNIGVAIISPHLSRGHCG